MLAGIIIFSIFIITALAMAPTPTLDILDPTYITTVLKAFSQYSYDSNEIPSIDLMIKFVENQQKFKQIALNIPAYTQIYPMLEAQYHEILVNYLAAMKTKIELMTKPVEQITTQLMTTQFHIERTKILTEINIIEMKSNSNITVSHKSQFIVLAILGVTLVAVSALYN